MLEKIEAELEALTLKVQSYSIGNRTMFHQRLEELTKLRKSYLAEVKQEALKERIKSGQSPLSLYTRFTL